VDKQEKHVVEHEALVPWQKRKEKGRPKKKVPKLRELLEW